jgi:gliding motility-associated-like protein
MSKGPTLTFFLVMIALKIFGQKATDSCSKITFQKIYTISTSSTPSKLLQTSDGGYIVAGYQTDETVGNGDGLILKLDKFGEKEWIKGYKRITGDYLISGICQRKDNSYIAVTNQFDSRGGILRINDNGTLIWQKEYFDPAGAITFYDVVTLPDDNMLISGAFQTGTFSQASFFIKINSAGNIIWQNSFDLSNQVSYPSTITSIGDTLIAAGIIPDMSNSNADTAYVLKLSSITGAPYSTKKIWIDGLIISGVFLSIKTDNDYILAIPFLNRITGAPSNCLIQLSSNLTLKKSIKLENIADGFIESLTPTKSDGNAFLLKNIDNKADILVKQDANFQILFAKYYQPNYAGDRTYSMTQIVSSADNGFIAAGRKVLNDSAVLYVLKTDESGLSGDCETVSVALQTSSIELSQSNLIWDNISELAINEENVSVPEAVLNSIDLTLCKQVTCNPNCKPIIRLDSAVTLCRGDKKELYPGEFESYRWNDGSVGKTLSVNKEGVYFVTVTDKNNCQASDTAKITSLLQLPSAFLPSDTSVCISSSYHLSAPNAKSYLWNDNSTSSFLLVDKPGAYWLEIIDENNCRGKDSINIAFKECISTSKEFFIPTAFTPNNDGKNDILKPRLPEIPRIYKFAIYNRWGQLVFQTADLSKGWDGRFNGIAQTTGVFAWTCSYQIGNMSPETKSGLVTVIR